MMGDVFYRDTVTIFNRKNTANTLGASEVWYPTRISFARLLVSKGNNVMKSGLESADAARLHIDDQLSLPSKPYKTRIEWDALSDAEKSNYWTLDSDKGTFFVEGDATGEQVVPNFFEVMKKKYENTFRVSSVDRFGLIPHFEVWGK